MHNDSLQVLLQVCRYTVYDKTFEGENFRGSSTIFIMQGKFCSLPTIAYFRVCELQNRKTFNGKTFTVGEKPRKPRKLSPSNVLSYTVQAFSLLEQRVKNGGWEFHQGRLIKKLTPCHAINTFHQVTSESMKKIQGSYHGAVDDKIF